MVVSWGDRTFISDQAVCSPLKRRLVASHFCRFASTTRTTTTAMVEEKSVTLGTWKSLRSSLSIQISSIKHRLVTIVRKVPLSNGKNWPMNFRNATRTSRIWQGKSASWLTVTKGTAKKLSNCSSATRTSNESTPTKWTRTEKIRRLVAFSTIRFCFLQKHTCIQKGFWRDSWNSSKIGRYSSITHKYRSKNQARRLSFRVQLWYLYRRRAKMIWKRLWNSGIVTRTTNGTSFARSNNKRRRRQVKVISLTFSLWREWKSTSNW